MPNYKAFFQGKRITLMGLGLLGRGAGDARFLARCGAELTVTDLKSEAELADSLAQLKDFPNITFHLGGHRLEDFEGRDLILKAAGVPLDSPFIAHARKNSIPVRMSADMFAELSGVPIVGVTGTRGKSTVTHLLAHILQAAGRKVLLGGNVRGVSTLALLERGAPDAIAVLELDSWQLQGFGEARRSPHVAVFTTFMPDHMNYYHGSMEAYFADKANIFLNQSEGDFFVVWEQVVPYIEKYGYKNKIKAHVIVATEKSLPQSWQLKIPGKHNRFDAALAAAAARVLGVEEEMLRQGIESFGGVPGRLELVRELRGVGFYNDTTATTPEATAAALEALDPDKKRRIVLIMGGADKGLDMSPLAASCRDHCKTVLLLAGTGTERIKEDVTIDAKNSMIYHAVSDAVQDAFAAAQPGDLVLLSPAFASFGMFKNEFDRGDQFVAAVRALS